MHSPLELALMRASEHASALRHMLAGLPQGAKLHPSSPHTLGGLSEEAAALAARLEEAVRLAESREGAALERILGMLGAG